MPRLPYLKPYQETLVKLALWDFRFDEGRIKEAIYKWLETHGYSVSIRDRREKNNILYALLPLGDDEPVIKGIQHEIDILFNKINNPKHKPGKYKIEKRRGYGKMERTKVKEILKKYDEIFEEIKKLKHKS